MVRSETRPFACQGSCPSGKRRPGFFRDWLYLNGPIGNLPVRLSDIDPVWQAKGRVFSGSACFQRSVPKPARSFAKDRAYRANEGPGFSKIGLFPMVRSETRPFACEGSCPSGKGRPGFSQDRPISNGSIGNPPVRLPMAGAFRPRRRPYAVRASPARRSNIARASIGHRSNIGRTPSNILERQSIATCGNGLRLVKHRPLCSLLGIENFSHQKRLDTMR
ncbi:hypothetical protein G1C96_1713 [Bifidobacterium sp. DSM 109958]|uniref:Uncharacterized protein n=1 Tax=Bifidobacterium moraviense TaxID=2675323 RepID=A0A7Y0F321_9BIFI|nr:hypothetical protein [Bifidobacterium sp. DSM 109958]